MKIKNKSISGLTRLSIVSILSISLLSSVTSYASYQSQSAMNDQQAIAQLQQYQASLPRPANSVQVMQDPRITLQSIDQKLSEVIALQARIADDQRTIGMVLMAQCMAEKGCADNYKILTEPKIGS